MRAARLAAAITLPTLALLPATATAASAATYTGDGSSPITVNAAGSTSPDGTALVLDPTSAAVPVSASGCTEQPSTVRWVLYPNDTQMPVGEGDIASTASDGTWSTTIDVAAGTATTTTSGTAAGTTSGAASGTGSANEQFSTSTAQQARPAAANTAARSTTSASHRGTLAHAGAAVAPLAISAVGILVVGVFLARSARRP